MASCSPVRKRMRRSTTPSYHVLLHASPCASRAHSKPNSVDGIRRGAPISGLGGRCRRCFRRGAMRDHVRKSVGLPSSTDNLRFNTKLAHQNSVP
eukprot:scaffold619_cov368-Pavlova_lutheri.AAC.6